MSTNPYFLVSNAIAYETTGVEIPASPGVNLTNDNMDMSWRSVGLSNVYVVLSCVDPVDTVAVLHSNLRSTDTIRVRAADEVADLTTDPAYDSGDVVAFTGTKKAPYTTKTRILLPESLTAKYWRFDFDAPNHPDGQVIASRVLLGERLEIGSGIDYNWEKQTLDDSVLTTGPNYEDVQEYPSRPGIKATLGTIDEQTSDDLDVLMMLVGVKKPVLFSPEPDNEAVDQHWTVYGRMKAFKNVNLYHNLWEADIEVAGLKA